MVQPCSSQRNHSSLYGLRPCPWRIAATPFPEVSPSTFFRPLPLYPRCCKTPRPVQGQLVWPLCRSDPCQVCSAINLSWGARTSDSFPFFPNSKNILDAFQATQASLDHLEARLYLPIPGYFQQDFCQTDFLHCELSGLTLGLTPERTLCRQNWGLPGLP